MNIDNLKSQILQVIESIELLSRRRTTFRDLLSVGELKVCMEFICDAVADEGLQVDAATRTTIASCCSQLGVDSRFLLD